MSSSNSKDVPRVKDKMPVVEVDVVCGFNVDGMIRA
jgi:hypothetical protein